MRVAFGALPQYFLHLFLLQGSRVEASKYYFLLKFDSYAVNIF